MKKTRLWAVIMRGGEGNGLCFTWDRKHPENKRDKETVRVYAIYPNKEDALADVRFRGGSYVQEVDITLKY